MDSLARTKKAPESRRTVDPLAMALFGVVRDLPASQRRVLLSAIDGRLHSVRGERARLALAELRRCAQELRADFTFGNIVRWHSSGVLARGERRDGARLSAGPHSTSQLPGTTSIGPTPHAPRCDPPHRPLP